MRKIVLAFLLGLWYGGSALRKLTHLFYWVIILVLLLRPAKIVWTLPSPGATKTKVEYIEKPVIVEKTVEKLVQAPAPKPDNWIDGDKSHYVGTVQSLTRTHSDNTGDCIALSFAKDDGTNVVFSLNKDWPPTWQKMHGEILLQQAFPCGYMMVSAKEWK